jgi:hypothetical protein
MPLRANRGIRPRLLAGALVVGLAAGASADTSDSDPAATTDEAPLSLYSVRAGAQFRWMFGSTRVRELNSMPDRLDLRRELGMDDTVGAHAEAWYEGEQARLGLEIDYFAPDGRGSVDHPFFYDEGNFLANVPFDTTSNFLFARATFAWKLLHWKDPSLWIGPMGGFEYPHFSLGLDQGPMHDSSEDYRQFMPYPVVGLAGRWDLTRDLDLDARLFGTYVDSWPTAFHEGGQLETTARTFDAEALLGWRVWGPLRLDVGATYQYFDGNLASHEDGNRIHFQSPGAILGLELRF